MSIAKDIKNTAVSEKSRDITLLKVPHLKLVQDLCSSSLQSTPVCTRFS